MTHVDYITLEIKKILSATLGLEEQLDTIDWDTSLLGNIPEIDSVAIVAIILTLEKEFSITIQDDEISAKTFATLGTLATFIAAKVAEKNHETR